MAIQYKTCQVPPVPHHKPAKSAYPLVASVILMQGAAGVRAGIRCQGILTVPPEQGYVTQHQYNTTTHE